MSQKPYCVAPFINLFYKGWDRKVKPCCEGSQLLQMDVVEGATWEDVWNHPYYIDLRETLMKGVPHEYCSLCVKKEKMGLANHREQYLKKAKRYHHDLEYLTVGGTSLGGPLSLDYRPSNVCNLKCRMCHPTNSSLFAKETLKHKTHDYFGFKDLTKLEALTQEADQDIFIDKIPTENLKTLKLLGGEPTLSEDVILFLQNQKDLGDLHLELTTNGNQFPSRFYEQAFKAKSLKINLSVDGVGKSYEYIRTPAKWDSFLKTFQKIVDRLPVGSTQHKLSLNFVLQIYNVFALEEILTFFIENLLLPHSTKQISLFVNVVDQAWLSPLLLNEDFIKDVRICLQGLLLEYGREPVATDLIKRVLQSLEASQIPSEYDRERFLNYTVMLDQLRNTKLWELDPRYYQSFGQKMEKIYELQYNL